MGKKQGVNTKVEAANAKKASIKSAKDAQKAAKAEEKESQEWSKGSNARSERRRLEEERKQQEAASKKAEKKRLEMLELESLQENKGVIRKMKQKKESVKPWEEALISDAEKKSKVKPLPENKTKVTQAMIIKMKEEEQLTASKNSKKQNILFQNELPTNRNRDLDTDQEARDIDQAIGLLAVTKDDYDKHPERRMKAAYKAFEEATLPQVKEAHPGLKLSQYKQKISELWRRSPQNPLNQQHVAYNHKKT